MPQASHPRDRISWSSPPDYICGGICHSWLFWWKQLAWRLPLPKMAGPIWSLSVCCIRVVCSAPAFPHLSPHYHSWASCASKIRGCDHHMLRTSLDALLLLGGHHCSLRRWVPWSPPSFSKLPSPHPLRHTFFSYHKESPFYPLCRLFLLMFPSPWPTFPSF